MGHFCRAEVGHFSRALKIEIMDRARELLDSYPTLTARDALHAAATLQTGAEAICSYDRDFDEIEGLRRIEPA